MAKNGWLLRPGAPTVPSGFLVPNTVIGCPFRTTNSVATNGVDGTAPCLSGCGLAASQPASGSLRQAHRRICSGWGSSAVPRTAILPVSSVSVRVSADCSSSMDISPPGPDRLTITRHQTAGLPENGARLDVPSARPWRNPYQLGSEDACRQVLTVLRSRRARTSARIARAPTIRATRAARIPSPMRRVPISETIAGVIGAGSSSHGEPGAISTQSVCVSAAY